MAFWNEVKVWKNGLSCFSNVNFSFLSCLGLAEDILNLLFHHILLSGGRHYIYRSKLTNSFLSRELFTQGIQTCLTVERHYAIQNGTLDNFFLNGGLLSVMGRTANLMFNSLVNNNNRKNKL